jgi:rhodanese-related sulfurtransferase
MMSRSVLVLAALASIAGCAGSNVFPPTVIDLTALQANEVIQYHQGNPEFVILDVRTPAEFSAGHLENAVNLDYMAPTFPDDVDALDRSRIYLVHCQAGGRSANASADMLAMGFHDLYDMVDGFAGWQAEGLPWTQ